MGAISHGKKSELVILDKGRRTAADFIDQVYNGPLLRFMEGFNDPILMEDGASIYSASKSKKWREDHKLKKIVWPAQSPDMNPIENLWSVMKKDVQKTHKPSGNTDALIKNIIDAWENIPIQVINRLVETIPARVDTLRKKKGKSTRF